jgi:hypothetical protein
MWLRFLSSRFDISRIWLLYLDISYPDGYLISVDCSIDRQKYRSIGMYIYSDAL